jgi:nucleolar protein 4
MGMSVESKEESHEKIDERHASGAENSEMDVDHFGSDDLSNNDDQTQRLRAPQRRSLSAIFHSQAATKRCMRIYQFGSVRYARAVVDNATERSKGTGFVCFIMERMQIVVYAKLYQNQLGRVKKGAPIASLIKHSVLENTNADPLVAIPWKAVFSKYLELSAEMRRSH